MKKLKVEKLAVKLIESKKEFKEKVKYRYYKDLKAINII